MPNLAGVKVCFLAGTLGQGGAERQLYYIVRSLVDAGARPRVLCLTKGEFWERPLRELGVDVEWVGQSDRRLRRLQRMVATLRVDRPDILQSQHFYTNLYAVAAGRLLGIPEIGALRSDAASEVREHHRLIGQLSLRAPRMVAANSRTAIDNAITLGMARPRLRFLPNVVDTTRFTVRTRTSDRAVRLLTVGRMVGAKRFDRFIRVVAEVRRRSATPVEATLIGDGPQRSALEAQARSLDLGPNGLRFLGAKGEVADHYHDADILLLTSDWEGTPNVLLEGMASGLPVVATDVGGVRDVVKHGETGILVPARDEAALANAVLSLVADRATRHRYGERARSFVEEHHAVAGLSSTLDSLYSVVRPGIRS